MICSVEVVANRGKVDPYLGSWIIQRDTLTIIDVDKGVDKVYVDVVLH